MNRKNPHFKEWLKTWNEIQVLEDYQSNQNWIPLESPYKKGYWISFDLREDIKNRQDAWVFYECIKLFGTTAWCRDKTMTYKYRKSKPQLIVPEKRVISHEKYESLPSAVQKYFSEAGYYHKGWNPFRKTYYCNIPNYFLVYFDTYEYKYNHKHYAKWLYW